MIMLGRALALSVTAVAALASAAAAQSNPGLAPALPGAPAPPGAPAGASTAAAAAASVPAVLETKKARFLDEKQRTGPLSAEDRKRWQARLDRRIGQRPARLVNIFNTWTHEFLAVEQADHIAAEHINHFFRCHFTNKPTRIDARLFRALVDTARHFESDRIDIVSGYRAPKYNLMLRKKGREVARDSQHTQGSAIDFRVRGVPVARLHAWVRRLRLGGVGIYKGSGFVHMDTGPVRYWEGR